MRFAPLAVGCLVVLLTTPVPAAEIIQLTAENYDELCPKGKEVDAIYGDYLIRNDQIVAVIAQPTAWRNANMTVRGVAAGVIDLTFRDEQNDQLSAFYPDARQHEYREVEILTAKGSEVSIRFKSAATADRPAASLTYALRDNDHWLNVTTEFRNDSDKPLTVALRDEVRADNTFTKVNDGPCKVWWADDNYWKQAYGIYAPDRPMSSQNNNRASQISYLDGDRDSVEIATKASKSLRRVIAPHYNRALVRNLPNLLGTDEILNLVEIHVVDEHGNAVQGAWIRSAEDAPDAIVARTNERGLMLLMFPSLQVSLSVEAVGHGPEVKVNGQAANLESEKPLEPLVVKLPTASRVQAKVTDYEGRPIACKVEFIGRDGTESPDFGHESEVYAIKNLRYTPDGTFDQKINPGKYDVIVSHGIEYDAYFGQITVEAGKTATLEAKLPRTVDTTGWVSTDFHSHASPSGDNTSSQLGRVLNLLAEHIEYAPCTEHNRIDTYLPHFETLKVNGRMATASGMELTGSPLPLNHQNAFPLVMKKGPPHQNLWVNSGSGRRPRL